MSDARASSHQTPPGLHHMPPSAVAQVMWPDKFSRQPSRARMRSAHASCWGTVSSRPTPGPGRGSRTGFTVARMRVLVIGATGELGSEVARTLVARGIAVRAMTRRADPLLLAGVDEVVRADLGDPSTLGAAFAGVQRVFLLSSPATDQV